jgi:hypothetical protein
MDTMESVIPILILYFKIVAVTFLVGFSITFLAGMRIRRRFTQSVIRYRKLPIILISALSILGGVLAVHILFTWDRAEQRAQSARRSAFVKHMQEAYPLELRVDLASPEPFTIIFSVPRDGEHSVIVHGYFAKETEYSTRHGGEEVVNIRESLQLRQGKNSFSFALNDGVDIPTSRNLDLIVTIRPRFPREQLINTRKGIAVSNSGGVELSEGINYYASAYNGCWINVYRVACVEYDGLYVDLSQ